MTECRISDLYDGLTRAVHNAFPNANVYETFPEQGLLPGDFCCELVSAAMVHPTRNWNSTQTTAVFEVVYVPAETVMRDIGVADTLLPALAEITLDSGAVVRGTGIETAYTDDAVLRTVVQYGILTRACVPETKMQSLEATV